jgi:hypothetical protein
MEMRIMKIKYGYLDSHGKFHKIGGVPSDEITCPRLAGESCLCTAYCGTYLAAQPKPDELAEQFKRGICDCENPEPVSGAALISNECPIHNPNPRVPPQEPASMPPEMAEQFKRAVAGPQPTKGTKA